MASVESRSADVLKSEIAAKVERLPVESLRTLADFASYLALRGQLGPGQAIDPDALAYQAHPETEDEAAANFAMSQEALAGEPWE